MLKNLFKRRLNRGFYLLNLMLFNVGFVNVISDQKQVLLAAMCNSNMLYKHIFVCIMFNLKERGNDGETSWSWGVIIGNISVYTSLKIEMCLLRLLLLLGVNLTGHLHNENIKINQYIKHLSPSPTTQIL